MSSTDAAALTIWGQRAKIFAMANSTRNQSMQPGPLATLVGYITGPSAQQPQGVRVVEPPPGTRQFQRGNFYALVELSGDDPQNGRLAEQLLSVMHQTYYSSKGSQSQVMVEAVNQARRFLREVNTTLATEPVRAGILCAALLRSSLLVVTSGSAFALVCVQDKVHMFPSDLENLADANSRGVEIFRQNVGTGDTMFLGAGSWLANVSVRMLASVVAFVNEENCGDAADELYEQSGQTELPGLLVVLGEEQEVPTPNQGTSQVGGRPTGKRTRRNPLSGLPTALSAAPPVRQATRSAAASPVNETKDQSVADHTATPESEGVERGSSESATQAVSPLPGEGQPADDFDSPGQEQDSQKSIGGGWVVTVGALSSRLSSSADAGVRQVRGFFARMLPDPATREAAPPPRPPGTEQSPSPMPERPATQSSPPTREGQERSASGPPEAKGDDADGDSDESDPASPSDFAHEQTALHSPAAALASLPDIRAYRPNQPASGVRSRILILVALLILTLVPAVVAVIYWTDGIDRRAQAQELTEAAAALVTSAQEALDLGDKVSARQQLTEAEDYLGQAIELDGTNEDRGILAGTINSELQEVLQIVPLRALAEPLTTFPADARPHRVIVADEDIFVLDAGRQLVLRYRYDPSTGTVAEPDGQVVLRQGDVIEGVTVGSMADIAWMPLIPGFEDKPSLLILDRNNNMFRYDPRVEGATLLEFSSRGDWRNISQVQTYLGRIYLADEGAGALLRYDPGAYDLPPESWFSEQTKVNLAGLISLEIDGEIWLLFSNGMILRYARGEQVPFSLENSIGFAEEPVDMYVTTQERSNIYLVDAAQDRILVYDKDGSYLSQLTAPEEDMLRGLSGLYVDEVSGTMYILTRSALFLHPLVD